MLSQSPRAFTEMLNVFRIESSHLTYHLESLGKLISKAEDGSYKLSAYGETAVSMIGKVEEKVEGMEEVIGSYTTRLQGEGIGCLRSATSSSRIRGWWARLC